MTTPRFWWAGALVLTAATGVAWANTFSEGFEGYNLGALDQNYSDNPAPDGGPGNPWFGPFPPNARVVTAENGVTPHSGNYMIRGKAFTGPADFDQNWLNIAYRFNNGQPFVGNVALDWWFYDVNGPGDANAKDYIALGFYNTAGAVPYTQDYPPASGGNLNTSVTQVERLSLGTYNGGAAWDLTLYQARVVGATSGTGFIASGWFNLPVSRSIGWHHARITVGPPPDKLVGFYIDDMNTPALAVNEVEAYGLNVIEINANFGTQSSYFDDLAFTYTPPPPPTGACCLGIDCEIMTQADCQAAGGVYSGDNSVCTNTSCCHHPFADADGDLDVDLVDFALFQACFTGDFGAAYNFGRCHCFDRDNDGAVALSDWAQFTICFSGPAVPADPSCGAYPTGNVLINELVYNSTPYGSDTAEFVELYNADSTPVDLSGWTLRGGGTTIQLPGAPGSGTTTIPPGGFYVIGGENVPNANFVPGSGMDIWSDALSTLVLSDGNSAVKDSVTYQAFQGAPPAIPRLGIWGAFSAPTNISLSRWLDGYNTGVNGRDFGMRAATPGLSNNSGLVTAYVPADVDGMTIGADVPGLVGSWATAKVIDPTDTSYLFNGVPINPNAIPASPQGGKCIVMWDAANGGGNMAASNLLLSGTGSFDIYVYFDTRDLTLPGAQSTAYGLMGTTDTNFVFPDPDGNYFPAATYPGQYGSNGSTGLAWVFQTNNDNNLYTRHLFLVDCKDGGNSSPVMPTYPQYWNVVTSIDMRALPSGWHRLAIAYTGATGAVVARFDDQLFEFTTARNLTGSFYVGYFENVDGKYPPTSTEWPVLRPPTFDLRPTTP